MSSMTDFNVAGRWIWLAMEFFLVFRKCQILTLQIAGLIWSRKCIGLQFWNNASRNGCLDYLTWFIRCLWSNASSVNPWSQIVRYTYLWLLQLRSLKTNLEKRWIWGMLSCSGNGNIASSRAVHANFKEWWKSWIPFTNNWEIILLQASLSSSSLQHALRIQMVSLTKWIWSCLIECMPPLVIRMLRNCSV